MVSDFLMYHSWPIFYFKWKGIPYFLYLILFLLQLQSIAALSRIFFNHSMPQERPLFVVNFDMGMLIWWGRGNFTNNFDQFSQHSEDPEDIYVHEISDLCDGKLDCYDSAAISDENFAYCRKNGKFNLLIQIQC